MIGTLINFFLFRSFVRDWNLYPSSIKYLNIIIYFLEYIFISFLSLLFYFKNDFLVSWKLTLIVLFYLLGYYIFKFCLNIPFFKNIQDVKEFFTQQFINLSDQENYLFSYFKIIFSFLLLSTTVIFIKKNKKCFLLNSFLFVIILIVISLIPFGSKDWPHAREVLLHPNTMGDGLFAESNEISEYFQKISDFKDIKMQNIQGKILELGSGCGNVTQYLVKKFGPENIISIEIDPYLCKHLINRFPGLTVIKGNAAEFQTLITNQTNIALTQIKGIVSTLPIGIFSDLDFIKFKKNIIDIVNKNSIKYMYYRFKFFEKEHRTFNDELKQKEDFIFINKFIIPVSVYTYEKK